MKRILLAALTAVLMLSMLTGCDVNWDDFDLTEPNFGLVPETIDSASNTDTETVSSADTVVMEPIDESYEGFVLEDDEGIVYSPWATAEKGGYLNLAQAKLNEAAQMAASLISVKTTLAEYDNPYDMAADYDFSRLLNNIRAWHSGAVGYPADGLKDNEAQVRDSLAVLGEMMSDYAARLPGYILNGEAKSISDYEAMIIGAIVDAEALIAAE